VHIFKLGSQKAGSGSSTSSKREQKPASPSESFESREGVQGLDGATKALSMRRSKVFREHLSIITHGYLLIVNV